MLMGRVPHDPHVTNWPDAVRASPHDDGPMALVRAATSVLIRHRRLFAAWVAACVALALLYAWTTPPSYTATATLLLEPQRPLVRSKDGDTLPPLDLYRADSELQVIKSERLLTQVFERLELVSHPDFRPGSPGLIRRLVSSPVDGAVGLLRLVGLAAPAAPHVVSDSERQIAFLNFAQRLDARRIGQSYVIEITYRASDPTLARKVANAAASAYIWQSVSAKAAAAQSGVEFVQGRINTLATQVSAADEAVGAGTIPSRPTPDADARVIGAALQPIEPSWPRVKLIVALGGAVGLLGGFFMAAFGTVLDRRIRSADDVRRATGLDCLATIPEVSRPQGLHLDRPSEVQQISRSAKAFSAAIHELRTSVHLACGPAQRDGHHVIAMASWKPETGCSTLCGHLANVIRANGRRVTLIQAVAHGHSWLWTRQSATEERDPSAMVKSVRRDEPRIMTAGGPVRAPGPVRRGGDDHLAFVSNMDIERIVADTATSGDVLLDLPPLCVSAEAKAAALQADAVVIVVAAGRTTYEELGFAVGALRGAGANLVGVVLNRASG